MEFMDLFSPIKLYLAPVMAECVAKEKRGGVLYSMLWQDVERSAVWSNGAGGSSFLPQRVTRHVPRTTTTSSTYYTYCTCYTCYTCYTCCASSLTASPTTRQYAYNPPTSHTALQYRRNAFLRTRRSLLWSALPSPSQQRQPQ